MKFKLIYLAIMLICLLSAVSAGLLSVHRSEGRIISPEMQAQIEAFLDEHDIQIPELPEIFQ
ncbi:MAG: hypothetical protein IJW70_11680 [Clostridia bacterium]|nr:hypothetical protein [Clostridia bacterium]